jgi:hypothetical protein
MTESASPKDMPGADVAETVTEVPTEGEPTPEKAGLSSDKLAELNTTLRSERNEAKRLAREAQERADALTQQFSELKAQLGVGKEADFDPKSAFDTLRAELESERVERLRSDVARITGVDPEDIKGKTEEQMRASAESYLERFNARLDAALKAKDVPAAPPASTVTSDGKISGPEQITSRDELKRMSPQEIIAARKDGRLNSLMGKSSA